MVVQKRSRRRNKKRSYVEDLPKEVWTSIISFVGAASLVDLFNARLTCKLFREASNDDEVYRRVTLEIVPRLSWKAKENRYFIIFREKCRDASNPYWTFLNGMSMYFAKKDPKKGMEELRMASLRGSLEATYVYGMLIMSGGGHSQGHGLQILNAKNWTDIPSCRDGVISCMRSMWVFHTIEDPNFVFNCSVGGHSKGLLYNKYVEHEILNCQSCRWYRELTLWCGRFGVRI